MRKVIFTEAQLRHILKESVGEDALVSAGTYIFCKDKDGVWNILCGKRAGNEPRFQGGLYNVPVGMREYGEPIVETARRECYEETGINIPSTLFKQVGVDQWSPNKYGANFLVIFNDVTDNHQTGNGDWENEKFEWLPVEKINSLRWAYNMNVTAMGIFNSFVKNNG